MELLVWVFAAALTITGVTIGSVRRVTQGNEAIVERFGRYHRKLSPGLNFGIFPIIDEVVVEANTRERLLDIQPSRVITSDGIILRIDAVLFWRVIDLFSAHYEIEQIEEAIVNLFTATLRSIVSEMNVKAIYSSRENINITLLKNLDEAIDPWGVKITRIEIQDVEFIETARDSVSFPFPNGINWQAFESSVSKVIVENEGVELSIESIEKRADGVLIIKVKVPPTADKEKIIVELTRNYEAFTRTIEQKYHDRLQGEAEQLSSVYQQHYSSLEQIIHKLADRPTMLESATIEVKAIAGSSFMDNSSNQSQDVNVSGNMNLSGSTLNLGEIGGNVTNTINQIQNSAHPAADQLVNLLKQLQTAIENEPYLCLEDKAIALEQISSLVVAGSQPNEIAQKPGKLAIGFLKGLASTLPDTAKLAEACSKLLPMITELLGL